MAKLGYYKDGFTLDGSVKADGLIKMLAATVTILKGQAIFNDGSGYATNATTAFADGFLGIAAADIDNSGGDGYSVMIIPALREYRWWVKVEADALIAQEDIGLICDLEANDSIDINDTTDVLVTGFQIYAMDVSADAVAINTYGYAYGSFVHTADES